MITPITKVPKNNESGKLESPVVYLFKKIYLAGMKNFPDASSIDVIILLPGRKEGTCVFVQGNFISIKSAVENTFCCWESHNGDMFCLGEEEDSQKLAAFSEMFFESLCMHSYRVEVSEKEAKERVDQIAKERETFWTMIKRDIKNSYDRLIFMDDVMINERVQGLIGSLSNIVPSVNNFDNPYYIAPAALNPYLFTKTDDKDSESASDEKLNVDEGLEDRIIRKVEKKKGEDNK